MNVIGGGHTHTKVADKSNFKKLGFMQTVYTGLKTAWQMM